MAMFDAVVLPGGLKVHGESGRDVVHECESIAEILAQSRESAEAQDLDTSTITVTNLAPVVDAEIVRASLRFYSE